MHHILKNIIKNFAALLPDKEFLKLRYYIEMGKKLNLKDPKTMNEKLQWLKLYNRNPIYTTLVDKFLVKDYIAKKIGQEYITKTYGAWHTFDDIDFNTLPQQFVLKTNHSGGNTGVVICKDKSTFDLSAAKNKLNKSLKSDIYKYYREWPYKNVHKLIFAEEYLEDKKQGELVDYKFYCFNGSVDSVMLCLDRQIGSPKFYFFDKSWNLKRYNKRGKDAPDNFTLPKPKNIDKMFDIASVLSQGIPFVRIDLYNIEGKIYFGEMTFYPGSGFDSNRLPETDLYFGDLIKLNLCSNTSR